MAISAFHYLTLSVRCEELDAHINYLYFLVFGLTRSRLEPTIYRTQGVHSNHYATAAAVHFTHDIHFRENFIDI
jgi:hypothetical protein